MAPLSAAAAASVLAELPSLIKRETFGERLAPSDEQRITLGVLAGYFVFICIAWNVWGLKHLLMPFKIWVVTTHEWCHAAAGLCTGARILSIEVEPNEGGVTHMKGGLTCWTLPAGYLGSSLIGALLIFSGFDTTASKVASIVVGVIMLFTLWWARRSWFTILSTLFAAGLLVAFWFIDHARPLRFYVLFVGEMSCLYALYDCIDDLILRKVNESDASQFAKHFGGSARMWGCLWLIVAFLFFAAAIVAGLATFKDSGTQQAMDAAKFIPTL